MAVVARLNKYASMQASEFDEFTRNTFSVNNNGTMFSTEFIENVGVSQIEIFDPFYLLDDIYALPTTTTYNPVLKDLTSVSYDILNDEFGISVDGSAGLGVYMSNDRYSNLIIYNEIDEVSSL